MSRTRTWTLVFALAAMLVTAVFAVAAYRVAERAFRAEFTSRLEQLAGLAASQVNPDDVVDARRLGSEATGFLVLQAQLDPFVVATGLANATVVDSSRVVVYDVREPDLSVGLPAELDSLPGGALRGALAGRRALASRRGADGAERWVAFAPVRREHVVVGVVALEGEPRYAAVLQRLRRTLGLVALVSVLAIGGLAAFLVRTANSALTLERRLSRAENLAAMGRLTATLAHEIKNPLAIVRGSAKRLGKMEPEQQALTDSIVEEVDRLSRTVNRYLQFARGEQVPGESGDAVAALTATLDLLEGEFHDRRVQLAREFAPGAAPVRLDSESLKQVFLNLVLNALEATPEGGRVRVTAAVADGRLEVVVHDSGPGLAPDVLARLGEPFVTTKAQGTGLGLFLARRLLRAAGGDLAANNAASGGAVVRVHLPIARG